MNQALAAISKATSFSISVHSVHLAFRAYVNMYGSFDAGAYPYAHSRAILKEALIRADLHIAGGFAGAKVKYSVPHDKR